jgi:hypothetical protein
VGAENGLIAGRLEGQLAPLVEHAGVIERGEDGSIATWVLGVHAGVVTGEGVVADDRGELRGHGGPPGGSRDARWIRIRCA